MRGLPRLRVCPNPSCPRPTGVVVSKYTEYRVCCEGCGMEGPIALTRRNRTEAIELWNGIARTQETIDRAIEINALEEGEK